MHDPGEPLKSLLKPAFDHDARERTWRKIQARTMRRRGPRGRPRWVALAAAALVLVAAAVAASPWRPWRLRVDNQPSELHVVKLTLQAPRDKPAPSTNVVAIEALPPSTPTASASGVAPPPVSPPPAPVWRALEARGDHVEAYQSLGPGGVAQASRTASVDDLLSLADVARLSGHPKEAVLPLERIVGEFPTDGRSSLAAFTLGRVYLDGVNDPASAAWAFQRAIDRGVPGGLEEDAYSRLVEAKVRSGDRAGAQAAYARSKERFPNGTHDAEMRHWLESY